MSWKRGGKVDRQARWGGREADEERVPTEAGVPLPAVGIEDEEGRPPAGLAGTVAGDDDLRGLADHVPPKADPGLPGELEADPRPLPDRGGHGCHEPGGLQDEEGDPCPPGQGRKPAKAVREPGRPFWSGRQVHDEEVHGPAGEERARDREPLLRVGRGEDDEPLGLDAAGHGLHRVECRREVQPGDDGATGLRLRGEPEGERGPPAREVTSEREAHPSGKSARPEDGVQLREPGREDAGGIRNGEWLERRHRDHCKGAPHLPGGARRGRTPARSKGFKSRRHVRGEGCHQGSVSNICSNESTPSHAPWPPSGPLPTPCYTLGPSGRLACCDAPVGM
jgi:hypothetical protein